VLYQQVGECLDRPAPDRLREHEIPAGSRDRKTRDVETRDLRVVAERAARDADRLERFIRPSDWLRVQRSRDPDAGNRPANRGAVAPEDEERDTDRPDGEVRRAGDERDVRADTVEDRSEGSLGVGELLDGVLRVDPQPAANEALTSSSAIRPFSFKALV
jgi:hypothetical protein